MSKPKRKVAVVTDSTSSLSPAMAEEYGLAVVPIYVMFGTRTYRDGVDLDTESFYRLLRASEQLPTTAQPRAEDFVQVYTALAEEAEAIVSIHISHKMSATLDSALLARRQLPQVPIHVIDTRSVSMGLGLIAIAAARAAAADRDAEEVVRVVEELIPRINILFTVETLDYLRRGGRIGRAAALVGSALKIRPVLQVEEGEVGPLEQPRTRGRALGRLMELMAERVGASPVHVAVLHCDVPDEAEALAEQVAARFDCVELLAADAGPIIGTHAGPGTLGLVFYTE